MRRLHPGSGAFDLYDDTRAQVYLGAEAETDRTNAIIDADPGAILVKGRHDRAINAFYHSTGGGATENNEYAFVGPSGTMTASPVAYLRGFADRDSDGKAFDAASPYETWQTATLTRRPAVVDPPQGRPDERRRRDEARPDATAACRAGSTG